MECLFDDTFYGEEDDNSAHPFEGQEMSCSGISEDSFTLPFPRTKRKLERKSQNTALAAEVSVVIWVGVLNEY